MPTIAQCCEKHKLIKEAAARRAAEKAAQATINAKVKE